MRNAIEAHIPGSALQGIARIEMPGQMQRRQHRQVDFMSSRPEAAGFVMNEFKRTSVAAALLDECNDSVLMLSITSFKIIWSGAGVSRHKKISTYPRTC